MKNQKMSVTTTQLNECALCMRSTDSLYLNQMTTRKANVLLTGIHLSFTRQWDGGHLGHGVLFEKVCVYFFCVFFSQFFRHVRITKCMEGSSASSTLNEFNAFA